MAQQSTCSRRRPHARVCHGVQVLSLHGTLDDIAPLHLGRALFDALPVAHIILRP